MRTTESCVNLFSSWSNRCHLEQLEHKVQQPLTALMFQLDKMRLLLEMHVTFNLRIASPAISHA